MSIFVFSTWKVKDIDLYSSHVIGESGSSLLFWIASCSSWQIVFDVRARHICTYIYIYTYIQMPIYILAQIDWIWYRRWVPATPEDVLRSTGGLNSMWSRWSQRRQRERWTETELQAPPSRTSQSSCLQWHGRGSLLFGQLFLVKPVAPWLYLGLQTPTSFAPVYVNWMSSWNVWHEC